MRRQFLKCGLLFVPALWACGEENAEPGGSSDFFVGELIEDPDEVLDLPQGFRCVVLETAGDTMSDGQVVGGSPDGMACFLDRRGRYVLMRNHELDKGANPLPELAFDNNRLGGVSRLVVEPKTLSRVSSNLVLTGTSHNCAGGPSPWGWLTCEETDEPGHGYVFLCDPTASSVRAPRRARSLGRFKHEACAVDVESGVIYLTEDSPTSAFYRHVPERADEPFVGKLQSLVVRGEPRFDTSEGLSVGDVLDVEWVDVEDPEATSVPTQDQAHDAGAAFFARGEGAWFARGAVFFACTSGGPLGGGQIFRLDVETQTLTLVAQVESEDTPLYSPDNVTVAPWGDLFIAEDNAGPNHIRALRQNGELYTFARNAAHGGSSEFCGVCFSPDGKVMFVNVQETGTTLAVTGPFPAS
jgi:secreted PhoX family phosphatase